MKRVFLEEIEMENLKEITNTCSKLHETAFLGYGNPSSKNRYVIY